MTDKAGGPDGLGPRGTAPKAKAFAEALRGIADGFDQQRPLFRPDKLVMSTLRRAADELERQPMCPRCARWKDRDDGMPGDPDERYLRRLLAVRVAMTHTYYDDGEAQGQEHGIVIDFMREPVADIDAKLRALNVARAIAVEHHKPPNVEAKAPVEGAARNGSP